MWILLLVFLFADTAVADSPLAVVRANAIPEIDGALNEGAWNGALVVSDFTQRLPQEGSPASERTEMRLLYTESALYIGVRAFDSQPDKIVATVMKRDDWDITRNDQLAFAIDSFNDGRNGYWFSTNPLGARVDAQFFDEGDLWVDSWNGLWESAARIDEDGWTAELRIPFSTLRFQPGGRNVMGINLFRRIIRTNEQLFAPLIPLNYPNGTPNVSAARKYVFEGIRGGHRWQWKPHLVGGVSNTPSPASSWDGNAGIDLRYAFSDGLTANVSFNTDFAEAEIDERQVNLTRFRLFFPEKRDFFLESAGTFQFGLPGETEIFFSRRIGLSDDGEAVPILAGGKMTGKIGNFDVGVLDVQTDDGPGSPPENFPVLRLKAGVAPRSYVGGIFTGRLSGESSPAGSYGLDMNVYLFRDISLTGFAASATNPDSTAPLKDRSAFHLALGRAGERTSFKLARTIIGDSFDPAVGFVQRIGMDRWIANLFVPFYFEGGFLRNITPGYEFTSIDDSHGDRTDLLHRFSVKFALPSEDQVSVYAQKTEEVVPEAFPVFRNRQVLPGKYESIRGGMDLSTKQGRPVAGTLSVSGGDFFGGSWTEFTPGVQWKINRHFTVSQFLSTNFVELNGESFRIDLLRSRIGYSLNTHFSASALLQYDNSTRQWGVNARVAYQFREGIELFVVYDEIREDSSGPPSLGNPNRRLLLKFTYLFER